jgi:hypothetical protein
MKRFDKMMIWLAVTCLIVAGCGSFAEGAQYPTTRTASIGITGGSVTIQLTAPAGGSFNFGTIELNRWFENPTDPANDYSNMTSDSPIVFRIGSTDPTNPGWNVTLSASNFTNGMQIQDITITAPVVDDISRISQLGNDPAGYSFYGGTLNDGSPRTLKIMSAPAGGGRGIFTFTIPQGNIKLNAYNPLSPGVPPLGTHSTTITATINSGP